MEPSSLVDESVSLSITPRRLEVQRVVLEGVLVFERFPISCL
jgi:hypothetical protein